MKYLILLLLLVGLDSCKRYGVPPTDRSSLTYRMDGTHFISAKGAPDEIGTIAALDPQISGGSFSTAPLPLDAPHGFAIGTRTGKIFLFSDKDSLENTITVEPGAYVDQLLADTASLYAITLTGGVYCYSLDGKFKWRQNMDGSMVANAILTKDALILPTETGVRVLSRSNGTALWKYASSRRVQSLAWDETRERLYAALTYGSKDSSDLIIVLDHDGILKASAPLPKMKITSNIVLAGTGDKEVVFGALVSSNDNQRSTGILIAMTQIESGKPERLWAHELPYIIVNIASNEDAVFASGFRTLETESISGIDAFSLKDTSSLWMRRFTEPVAFPIAAGSSNIYFTLQFASEAIVASRGLFYTLDASTGKTIAERPVKGALHGFAPQMPMPDARGRFLLADHDRAAVYTLY